MTNDLPSVGTEDARKHIAAAKLIVRGLCEGWERWTMSIPPKVDTDSDFVMDRVLSMAEALVSERDELASRVMELEGALWGCIAAIERTHHCTEADRLASADAARAALSAKKGGAA